ncbi:MAG TPA: hypothetical protein VFT24_03620 [Vicinamibacterales bacterium]|nr:hypothetical protein [Vicinamibacterales bacterium]
MTSNMRLIISTSLALLCASSLVESQRIRYGPGVCGPLDQSYVMVATGTGGQPFPVSPDEIAKSLGPMSSPSLKELILWASGDRERSYLIPVDSTVTRVMLAGTFDGTGGGVSLTAPDGSLVQQGGAGVEDTSLNCGRIVVVDTPAAGNWQVRVAPTGRFWLTVHAKSDLSLTRAEFVERDAGPEPGRFVRIPGEPIAGKPATLRVSVASGIKNPTFHLISVDAQPIRAVEVQSTGDGEFIGVIEPPREAFRVMVTGRDDSDLTIQRIAAGLFHSEPIEIVPPGGETVTAGATLPVTFTIRNHGPAVHLRLVAVDGRGQVMAVDPASLDLAAAAEAAATVRLIVPPAAEPLSQASIRLTAASGPLAAVGGFNSAQKTYTIVAGQED